MLGVIHDPIHDETFTTLAGAGAVLNGAALTLPGPATLADGTTRYGHSNRMSQRGILEIVAGIDDTGGGIEAQDADDMIARGGRVVVGAPGAFEDPMRLSDRAFG